MSRYRIQIRSEGWYFNGIVVAQNDTEALRQFAKKLKNGEVEGKDEGFYYSDRVYITYEELKNGTTEVDIGKTSAGVQMGQPSVETR